MRESSSAVSCSRPIIAKSKIRAAASVRLSRTDHELSEFLIALKRCWCLSPKLIFRILLRIFAPPSVLNSIKQPSRANQCDQCSDLVRDTVIAGGMPNDRCPTSLDEISTSHGIHRCKAVARSAGERIPDWNNLMMRRAETFRLPVSNAASSKTRRIISRSLFVNSEVGLAEDITSSFDWGQALT